MLNDSGRFRRECLNLPFANPHVSSTACVNLSYISWYESYIGRSSRLKQVCAFGRFCSGTSAVRWMVKSRGPTAPVEPWRARKPWSGTRHEPVTNWSSWARISGEYDSTICQKKKMEPKGSQLNTCKLFTHRELQPIHY
uniref:Uncharacterized protein n=1 Tax=Anopheles melas TaxID=34690 RepID=A0A182TVC5_9DIPT